MPKDQSELDDQLLDQHVSRNKKDGNNSAPSNLDRVDIKLIDMMLSGLTPRQSAEQMGKPVSTIQRRARLLIKDGILRPNFELGYSKLGIKKGLLHVYLKDGNISEIVDKLQMRKGIFVVSVHLGNSDIIATFIFKDSRDVLDLIAWTKRLPGVEKVVWSEEVYSQYGNPGLQTIIGNGNGRSSKLRT